VMAELHRRVRERLRSQLADTGAARTFDDPTLFAEVESLLRAAASTPETTRLLLCFRSCSVSPTPGASPPACAISRTAGVRPLA
jgi:hypothetical protein